MSPKRANTDQPAESESALIPPAPPVSEDPGDLLAKIQQVLSGPSHDLRTALIREMLVGVIKMYEQPIELLDIKIVNRALKELRYAFRVFQPYEHCLKVSIYGSARTRPEDPDFQLAARFGRLSARLYGDYGSRPGDHGSRAPRRGERHELWREYHAPL